MTISIFLIVSLCIKAVEGSDQYTDLGSTTTLVCPFKADSGQNIRWNGPPNYSTQLSIGSGINPALPNEHKLRLSISGNFTIREYNLKITYIQQSDEGGYRCNGISGGSSTFNDVNLLIQAVEGSDQYTDLGSTTTLVCPFKADSGQDIRWIGPPNYSAQLSIGSGINPTLPNEHKSRLSITGNFTIREFNLKITNIQQSDEGRYRCTGISGGSSTFNDVNLLIQAVEGSVVYTDIGSTTTLVCPIKTDLGQDIRWTGPPNYSAQLSIGSGINPTLPNEHKSRLSITGNFTIREYNLKITNIQQSDEGRYRCTGISGGSLEFHNVNLLIQVAPLKSPVISVDPPGDIIAGSNIILICTILGGTPLATISWECPGSGQAESGSDLSNAVSTVQFVVNKNDNGKMCQCKGSHSLWTLQRTANITMDIKYAPDENPIINQQPGGGIARDSQVQLTCTITGGNPLSTLGWDCDGITTNETTENITSFSITFTVDKTYNNRICTCVATHIVPSYRSSVQHKLIVYYEPENEPSIDQAPPGYIIAGTNVILTCEVLGGNPLAMLSWNCTGLLRNNTSVNKASYSIEILVNRTFNNIICACSATHYILSFRPTVRHLLDVYFKPFLDNTRPYYPSNISATENKILQITIAINANPKPTIQWTFKADTDCNFSPIVSNTTTDGFLSSSSISIDKVQSSDFGEFNVTANNTVGIFFHRIMVIKEASPIQETCAHTQETTSMFVVGIVTLVVGLLSLTASVIFIVRNSIKNKTIKCSKTDEYTGVQQGNPTFMDEYTTIQSEIESRQPQEQSSHTYEEFDRITETNHYRNVNAIGFETKHPQEHTISNNTYEECGRNFEAHNYDTLDK